VLCFSYITFLKKFHAFVLIISGTGTGLQPLEYITRAQAAVLVYNALGVGEETEPEEEVLAAEETEAIAEETEEEETAEESEENSDETEGESEEETEDVTDETAVVEESTEGTAEV
ncbi:MAG: hypothetical protein LUD77_11525, partial [Clostridiales bacterium]|nr:hypothetical protein [Clostridiales bacterium]